jgi:hypothetical protein
MSERGNCGCRLCGLRGWSKNVMTRSVFPDYGEDYALESFENGMTGEWSEEKQQYLFGSRYERYNPETGEYTLLSLAETLIAYLQRSNNNYDGLKVLLCIHDWVQDEGTATV